MTLSTEDHIPVTAKFYETENGYWLAWSGDSTAFVLTPDLAETESADQVKSADDVDE